MSFIKQEKDIKRYPRNQEHQLAAFQLEEMENGGILQKPSCNQGDQQKGKPTNNLECFKMHNKKALEENGLHGRVAWRKPSLPQRGPLSTASKPLQQAYVEWWDQKEVCVFLTPLQILSGYVTL